MQTIFAIGIAGALGTLARYGFGLIFQGVSEKIQYGTLFCNVLGSLLMGVLFVFIVERAQWHPDLRPLLMIGFAGAFTTFSTFSLETVKLLSEGHIMLATLYILLSVVLSIVALICGLWFARLF